MRLGATGEADIPDPGSPVPGVPQPGEAEQALAAVRRAVTDMLADGVRPPRMLRIRAGDVCVEMEWPDAAHDHPTQVLKSGVAPEEPGPVASASEEALVAVMVGVFYRAPQPGAAPFVTEGDHVVPGQQVAIIEAMKLMIPVEADRAGRITAVLVPDGQSVEYGQPLFMLEPGAAVLERGL